MGKEKDVKKEQKVEYPDTPSGKALQAVGNLDGEVGMDAEKTNEHGEAYQAVKKKERWG